MATAQVTVRLTGTDKENVVYVTVGNQRWGHNGANFGTTQAVTQGANVRLVVGYSGGASDGGNFSITGNCTFTVEADGPGNTHVVETPGNQAGVRLTRQ